MKDVTSILEELESRFLFDRTLRVRLTRALRGARSRRQAIEQALDVLRRARGRVDPLAIAWAERRRGDLASALVSYRAAAIDAERNEDLDGAAYAWSHLAGLAHRGGDRHVRIDAIRRLLVVRRRLGQSARVRGICRVLFRTREVPVAARGAAARECVESLLADGDLATAEHATDRIATTHGLEALGRLLRAKVALFGGRFGRAARILDMPHAEADDACGALRAEVAAIISATDRHPRDAVKGFRAAARLRLRCGDGYGALRALHNAAHALRISGRVESSRRVALLVADGMRTLGSPEDRRDARDLLAIAGRIVGGRRSGSRGEYPWVRRARLRTDAERGLNEGAAWRHELERRAERAFEAGALTTACRLYERLQGAPERWLRARAEETLGLLRTIAVGGPILAVPTRFAPLGVLLDPASTVGHALDVLGTPAVGTVDEQLRSFGAAQRPIYRRALFALVEREGLPVAPDLRASGHVALVASDRAARSLRRHLSLGLPHVDTGAQDPSRVFAALGRLRRPGIASSTRPTPDSLIRIGGRLTTESDAPRVLRRSLEAGVALNVHGEIGTGKTRLIELAGLGRWIIDGARLDGDAAEAEVFGVRRGAFTGAETDRPGLLESAHGSVVVLDNVEELRPTVQAKLLRVLESGEVRPIGGDRPVDARFGIVVVTHRPLSELVEVGRLRGDLYYRLLGLEVALPPLRKCSHRIESLLLSFLPDVSGRAPRVEPSAVDRLRAHPWPGNVRELEAFAARLALESKARIRAAHVDACLDRPVRTKHATNKLRAEILDHLDRHRDGLGSTDLARRFDCSRRSIQRQLGALVDLGLVLRIRRRRQVVYVAV